MTSLVNSYGRTKSFRKIFAVSFGILCLNAVWFYLHPAQQEQILQQLGSLVVPQPPKCRPYDQLGHLRYSESRPHNNRWVPYQDSCPAPALVASVARSSWQTQPHSIKTSLTGNWTSEELGPDGKGWVDAEWARGKTVLYMGDSIGRFNAVYFCEMMGETLVGLDWTHAWTPPEVTGEGPFPLPPAKYEGPPLPVPTEPVRAKHSSHYCHVPGIDLLLIQIHTVGLDQERFWIPLGKARGAPYTYEDRINYLAKGYIDRAKAMSGRSRSAPELVYLTSALWDLARWMVQDVDKEDRVDTTLSTDRLNWYRQRIRDVLVTASEAFPRASVTWLVSHYPIGGKGKNWFLGGKGGTRPQNKLIRLTQAGNAAKSAYQDLEDVEDPHDRRVLSRVGTNRWGELLMGTEQLQIDDIHHRWLPGGYLWADMMLWDLRDVVTR